MTGAQATFDGSTNPGTVMLRDFTGVEARASFATDAEAKLFYGLVLDLIDGAARDRFNLDKAVRAMRAAMKACEEACDD